MAQGLEEKRNKRRLAEDTPMRIPAGERAVGLQLMEQYAMVTVFAQGMKDPETIRVNKDGESRGEDPYLLPMPEDVWKAAKGQGETIEKLRDYLLQCLRQADVDVMRHNISIMVTVPKLDLLLSERVPQALELLGIPRRQIYLQDHLSGFYYYTVNQRRDLWNSDVALLEYRQDTMLGYVLHVDRTKIPAIVTVSLAAKQTLGERERDGRSDADWNKEKDRLFFELLKKVFEGRGIQTVYLVGNEYDRSWAERSFQYMCGGRHAFQGMNLYTKGACYAAMERAGFLRMGDMLFMGEDIVSENLGMQMRIQGKDTYYPLVTAGVNWYEAHHECQFIVDEENQITILSKPMTGGDEIAHILQLDHFPQRPARATRLKLVLYFTAPHVCVLEIEDMGFGGFFPSSHKRWKRKIYL